MASLEDRVRQSSRRGSAVPIVANPLEEDTASALSGQMRLVKLSETSPINKQELKQLCDRLQALGDNQAILDSLESEKQPFMFLTADLIQILNITTSIKTKLAIITALAPRLSDPKAGMEQVVSLFRYSEDKSAVEEAIKSRIQTLTGAAFSRGGGMLATPTSAGRGAGRGGRGFARGVSQRPSLENTGLEASSSEAVKSITASTPSAAAEEEDSATIQVSRKPFSG